MQNNEIAEGIQYYQMKQFVKGMHYFETLINKKEKSLQIYYYYANCLYGGKLYQQAAHAYSQAKEYDVYNVYEEQLYMKIGECYRNLKEFYKAHDCFDKVIKKYGKFKENALYSKGQTFFEAENYLEAISVLKEYKKVVHQKYLAEIELALCYFKVNDNKSAYLGLNSAINNSISNEHLARIYYSLAKVNKNYFLYDEATKKFQEMQSKIPTVYNYCDNIVYIDYISNNFKNVIKEGEKILKSIKKPSSNYKENMLYIYVGNAYYFQEKDLVKTNELHSQYQDHFDCDYQFEMAKVYFVMNDQTKAYQYLKFFEENENGKKFVPGLLLLSSYYQLKNNIEKVDLIKEKINNLSPNKEKHVEIINYYDNHMKQLTNSNQFVIKTEQNIGKEIGKGGCGQLFLKQLSGKDYVVKKILDNITGPDKELIKINLQNEIKLLIELTHTNIIRTLGFMANDELYLEYCPGKDLASYRNKNLRFDFKCYVISQIAEGLKYLHQKDIIHGDMKTQNILLSKKYEPNQERNDYPIIKLCDFGLAKSIKQNLKEVKGKTVQYAAPELFEGNLSTKESDVYAFGVIICELITDTIPFVGVQLKDIESRVKNGQRPEINEDLLENEWTMGRGLDIRRLMQECWAQEPKDRLKMEQVCSELEKYNTKMYDEIE